MRYLYCVSYYGLFVAYQVMSSCPVCHHRINISMFFGSIHPIFHNLCSISQKMTCRGTTAVQVSWFLSGCYNLTTCQCLLSGAPCLVSRTRGWRRRTRQSWWLKTVSVVVVGWCVFSFEDGVLVVLFVLLCCSARLSHMIIKSWCYRNFWLSWTLPDWLELCLHKDWQQLQTGNVAVRRVHRLRR